VPSPTPSTPTVAVPLPAAQASPAPFPYEKVVEIESDEDSAEGSVSKRLRPTMVTTSHSSTVGRPASSRDQTPSAPSSSYLFALVDGGASVPVAPSTPELPAVLQHALKGFHLEMTVDSDETVARERLGLNFGALLAQSNALITKPEARVALVEAKAKEETTLLARSFATCEVALKQELTSLCQSEKDLSKRLHVKCEEAVEQEANILPLRIRVIELKEAAEASKAKMARLEERSINREVHLGHVEPELLQQAKRFKEAKAELIGVAVEAYDARFEDALAQVVCAHPEMNFSHFAASNRVVNEQIVSKILPF